MTDAGWVPQDTTWRDVPEESIYVQGEHLRVYNFRTKRDKPFLTDQERKIANALELKLPRRQIAEILRISMSTVRWHIFNLRRKAFAVSV